MLPDAWVARQDQFTKLLTEEQKKINKHALNEKAGFSNVIGCIDVTHVHIQAPSEDNGR